MNGAELIAAERQRQIEQEGWSGNHDDRENWNGQLIVAAACYLVPDRMGGLWPWHPDWWKPTPNDRIRELTKAGALIAAEIDRLQRDPKPLDTESSAMS